MMDIFEKPMSMIDSKGEKVFIDSGKSMEVNTGDLRQVFFSNISDGKYPNLMFLLLTKRPSNINKYIPESWKTNPPENVMFGTSPVNQETADKLIAQLLQVSGKKFLSIEPMLNEIDLSKFLCEHFIGETGPESNNFYCKDCGADDYKDKNLFTNSFIEWVIVGGESGHGKRPFNPDWARSIRGQCQQYHVPFFMKQIDKIQPIPDDLMIREFPEQ